MQGVPAYQIIAVASQGQNTNSDDANDDKNNNKKPTNWWGKQKAAPLKFDPKRLKNFVQFFSNFHKCQPEVADNVIYARL